MLPFHWHLIELTVIVAAGFAHRVLDTTKRQKQHAMLGLIALAVFVVWPLGDLAASVSLTFATVQRLVIMLLVAPQLLLSIPTPVMSRLTRPAPVDFVTRKLAHPGVAIVVVTVVGTLTLASPVVDAGATSQLAREAILLVTLLTGILLWIPGLGVLPGAKRLSPAGRAGFIFASALVVTSLSFVWIFSTHSLYPSLHYQQQLLHVTPVFDQQFAGFVAKLGCYFPMWAVAFRIFFHADDQGISVEETPLHWADVERQMLRVDRQRQRALRRHRPE